MSVYTAVSREQLEHFLSHYSLGKLLGFQGIRDGIENTNYFVTTSEGEYVLTLFESLDKEELPYFLELMAYLAEHDIPSAHPQPDDHRCYLRELNGKPATIVNKLNGQGVGLATLAQCHSIGAMLAKMHVASTGFPMHRKNERGPAWWHETAVQLKEHLTYSEGKLLDEELHFQHQHQNVQLPGGVIHADLFRDNALFVGDNLTGLIDFYYACNDIFIYDLAITANDWCGDPDGSLDHTRLDAMLNGYNANRLLLPEEKKMWPVMLRAAALRFWLSRLLDNHFPRPGEVTHTKDPDTFRKILEDRKNRPATLKII